MSELASAASCGQGDGDSCLCKPVEASSAPPMVRNRGGGSAEMGVGEQVNADGGGGGAAPRRVVRRVKGAAKKRNVIPDSILKNAGLNQAISILPANYNFEIHKTVWRIQSENTDLVALQFPEGLLMYSCVIADILSKWGNTKVIILGDVTYGACCIDDFSSQKLGADLLIHYGHSCLVPIGVTRIKVMYVFVEIKFDESHLIQCLTNAFSSDTRMAIMGTIQFTSVVYAAHAQLKSHFPQAVIPQAKPLSGGETLGCTAPVLEDVDILVFVADGRFHLEAAMIRNPSVKAYRYDPYGKKITHESYDIEKMKSIRKKAITKAQDCRTFGLVLGTLGRQGNVAIFKRIRDLLRSKGKKLVPFLMAEINPVKLELMDGIDAWVQVACPRLSIDWSDGFDKPILTPYELEVAMKETAWREVYPMDFYSNEGNPWSAMSMQRRS